MESIETPNDGATMKLEVSFRHGLTTQYPEIIDLIDAGVHASGRPEKAIALDCDMSPKDFSKRKNGTDGLVFPLQAIPAFIEATGDLRLIYWLIEKFLVSADENKQKQMDRIESLMREMQRQLAVLQKDDNK